MQICKEKICRVMVELTIFLGGGTPIFNLIFLGWVERSLHVKSQLPRLFESGSFMIGLTLFLGVGGGTEESGAPFPLLMRLIHYVYIVII